MSRYITLVCLLLTSLAGYAEENIELLISQDQIHGKIDEVAAAVNHDYKDKKLTILMVMKGAVCITADFIRKIDVPFTLEYIKASSYGRNGMTSGNLTLEGLDRADLEGRDILVVDDIFETGKTMLGIIGLLKAKNPRSVKTLLLLVKNIPRNIDYRPDYTLFDIEDRFVIGYGLDYKELYRSLPGIYAFVNDTPSF